jgi:hypothetical protein
MFDKALAEAGFDRDRAYVTNAVKHFNLKTAVEVLRWGGTRAFSRA